jgi:hypothetical protein
LLNQYFVPVTSRNEETEATGTAPPAEKKERSRIYNEFYAKKLGLGDVLAGHPGAGSVENDSVS